MFKIVLGLFLIVVSVMLSFIPPFIFGLPVAFLAFGLIVAGLGKTAGHAVKGGWSAANYFKDKRGLSFNRNDGNRHELPDPSLDRHNLPNPGRYGWRS